MHQEHQSEREAWQVVATLEEAGHEAYLVGGCVRDKLLQRGLYDYDITTSALPEEVLAIFRRTVPTGIKHGTVTVLMERDQYEVTTFRTDGEYKDGRRPEEVVFVRSLREDLARRDFTINAMALGRDGRLHDPFGGQEDLQRRVIRAVGDPVQRFEEDALRMLRAVRFAAQLRFTIEERTLRAIQYEAASLQRIARERIRDEWHKMLLSSPDVALQLLRQTDTLRYILSRPPTFDLPVHDPWGYGRDPWELAGEWMGRAPEDLAVRYCVLFIAIQTDEARLERTLQELKLPTQMKQDIKACHRLATQDDKPRGWSDLEWRHLFYQYGYDTVARVCQLHCSIYEPGQKGEWDTTLAVRKAQQPLWSLQDLAVTGQDLMANGVPAGPEVGKVLKRLAHQVLHEPELNQKERLLRIVREF
ncbi:MAG TPA: CCA tRNA nucleotidyltransferase [Bacilli bacterium]|nr:CCA tRNA nucleotidyltransferase [Bacilli bacterium]